MIWILWGGGYNMIENTENLSDIEMINLIKNAKNSLKKARNLQCKCMNSDSSMGYMRDGCGCDRKKMVVAAEKYLWDLIEKL